MELIKKYYPLLLLVFITLGVSYSIFLKGSRFQIKEDVGEQKSSWWIVQSIDTVKYSRDLAREKLDDPAFANTIDKQVGLIARAGATHVAVGTPYDDEFIPFLKLWANTARKYELNVWFRGNFSGWEGWFGYSPIGKEEHIQKTVQFIILNSDLFEDGDIFTSCTECENGQLGDPRYDVGVNEYRNFLIEEYEATGNAFDDIGKNVASNYYPMNGDVAKLVMDRNTTEALSGLVVIDHYVDSPEQLTEDIKEIAQRSGGKVVLGEFGAPIPDIHGYMTETQQAVWIREVLDGISQVENLIGVNYWTSFGGTTKLWDDNRNARESVDIITDYYSPILAISKVVNELGKPVRNAEIIAGIKREKVNRKGEFKLAIVPSVELIEVKAKGYKNKRLGVEELRNLTEIVLVKEKEDIIFKFQKLFK